MELLEGETLRQRLESGVPFDNAPAVQILRGLCDALTTAHNHGLIHRDLKPENIFLQRHEGGAAIAKVLDFGLAKALAAEWPVATTGHGRESSAGLLIGTLDYMAPEQVAGDAASPDWDLWALSVIAFEMLTGRHPFRRTMTFPSSTTGEHVGTAAVVQADGALSAAAAGFFEQALSSDRAKRPRSAAEFLARCDQVLT
jgi:serine/threonine-protein kinase